MIHKIRIRPAVVFGTYLHYCQFTDPITGKLVSLLENGKHGKYQEGDLPPGKVAKQVTFQINPKRINFAFEFQFDDTKADDDTYRAYRNYWLRDMRVQPPKGEKNPNYYDYDENGNIKATKGSQILVMEDVTEAEISKKGTAGKKNKVFQKYASLADGGQHNKFRAAKNVAYYFGVADADKLDSGTKDGVELFNILIGDFNGILMQEENIDKFLKYESEDFFVQLSINARRAIEKGFIQMNMQKGKPTYFINNHPVGDSEMAVITYLDNNKDFYYQYVVEKLGDEAERAEGERKEHVEEVISTIDLPALQNKAADLYITLKKMGIKKAKVAWGGNTKDPEKLKEAIAEAEDIIARESKKEMVTQ